MRLKFEHLNVERQTKAEWELSSRFDEDLEEHQSSKCYTNELSPWTVVYFRRGKMVPKDQHLAYETDTVG